MSDFMGVVNDYRAKTAREPTRIRIDDGVEPDHMYVGCFGAEDRCEIVIGVNAWLAVWKQVKTDDMHAGAVPHQFMGFPVVVHPSS